MRNMNCELIGPRKLEYYINNPYSYIIDIRSKEMYDSGHIKGAENYPYDYLSSYEGIRAFKSQYRDKSAIYIYYIAKLEQIVCLYVISLHYMGIL